MTDRRIPRPAEIPDDALDVWISIRQVDAMSQLNAEVNNGGFSQLMWEP